MGSEKRRLHPLAQRRTLRQLALEAADDQSPSVERGVLASLCLRKASIALVLEEKPSPA